MQWVGETRSDWGEERQHVERDTEDDQERGSSFGAKIGDKGEPRPIPESMMDGICVFLEALLFVAKNFLSFPLNLRLKLLITPSLLSFLPSLL